MRYLLIAATANVFCISTASADETLKYRSIWHTTFIQSQNIPDTDGHIIPVTSASGVASFPDGSVAMDNFTGTLDYTKWSGTFMDYNDITFSDGSTVCTKQLGTTTSEGQQSTFKGTITIIGGKGRFAGAKGDGTFRVGGYSRSRVPVLTSMPT